MYVIKMSSPDENFKQLAIPFTIYSDSEPLIREFANNREKKYFKLISNSDYSKTIKGK